MRSLTERIAPNLFGDQVIANEYGEVEGFCDLQLIGAAKITLADAVAEAHRLGGLVCAAHIDLAPMGDSAATLTALVMGNAEVDYCYRHEYQGACLRLLRPRYGGS